MTNAKPQSRPPGLAPRAAAAAILAATLDRGRQLDEAQAEAHLAARLAAMAPGERAQTGDLAMTALRRLGQIDAVIGKFLTGRQSQSGVIARHALRIAAAEMLFMGAKPHAAVDMAVRVAKADRGAQRLAGLVNAVARRIAEEGPAMAARQDAAQMNAPKWLWRMLSDAYGKTAARAIAEAHLAGARIDLTLRSGEDADAWAVKLGAAPTPTGSLRAPRGAQVTAMPGYAEGAWWVQDAAAALPVRMLGDLRGARALDLCAAPGGKTMQMAAAGAQVTALDISAARLDRLTQNLARTGLDARTVCTDIFDWSPEASPETPSDGALFDAVLLDAPCSATGTIRRHPDLPHVRDIAAISALTRLQDRMLDRAWGFVRPGGRLVFCTCSLSPSEGEKRIAAFFERTPGAARAPLQAPEIDGAASLITPQGNLRTRPDMWADLGGLDGFFAARIEKAT